MNVKERDIYRPSEDAEQEAVVKYCDLKKILVVHIANEGRRSVAYAVKLKRVGMRTGFPDLFFPIPIGDLHGLFIEMKSLTGRATPAQKWWIAELRSRGYRAEICHGADAAIRVIDEYLKGG